MSELLTEEQKNIILEEWNSREENPPSLLELIRLAFPDKPDIDGRSKEGRSVKAFLATRNLSADGAHVYKHKDKIDLTEEQIQFIENNAAMMKALEIAKVIFKNNELIISYEKSTIQIEKIINFLQQQQIIIKDISTDDGNLEDVFVKLTKR